MGRLKTLKKNLHVDRCAILLNENFLSTILKDKSEIEICIIFFDKSLLEKINLKKAYRLLLMNIYIYIFVKKKFLTIFYYDLKIFFSKLAIKLLVSPTKPSHFIVITEDTNF